MITQIIGWFGASILILAYVLLTKSVFTNNSSMFHVLNIAGAVLLGISSAALNAWFSVGLNIFWIIVATYGLKKSTRS